MSGRARAHTAVIRHPALYPAARPEPVARRTAGTEARGVGMAGAGDASPRPNPAGFRPGLEQDEHVFAPIYDGAPHQLLKLIRYPGRVAEDAEQGVGAHKDSALLSLILQDENGGLQVEASPGVWIDAAPREGTFVVNIGELLELAPTATSRRPCIAS